MQDGCRNVARASGRCALSSACTDSVSGRVDLFGWLFVVMCENVGICLRALRGWVHGLWRIIIVDVGARP